MKSNKIFLALCLLPLFCINYNKLGIVKGCFSFSSSKPSSIPPLVASKGSEKDTHGVSFFGIDSSKFSFKLITFVVFE